MTVSDAIVRPYTGGSAPQLGSLAIMAATRGDLLRLCRGKKVDTSEFRRIMTSRLYVGQDPLESPCLVGPLVGAPYAVMVLECLVAWGVRKVLFFGWCGSISSTVSIGDIILVSGAHIDEGTSSHYLQTANTIARPSSQFTDTIRSVLVQEGIPFHEGLVWTTDGVFRETPQKVTHYQAHGVLGVEMEASALFTVGRYLHVEVGALMVVSDDLSNHTWQPGFKDPAFTAARRAACGVIEKLWPQQQTTLSTKE